jgi:hypothetical protein
MDSQYTTDAKNVRQSHKVIAPNAWAGERGCWIGPFNNVGLAKTFSETLVIAFASLAQNSIIENREQWYIDMPDDLCDEAH